MASKKTVSHFNNWVIACLIVSLSGVLINLAQVGLNVEEELGLQWLFQIRGARPHPNNIVVVSTDRQSAYELDLPQAPYKWPRSLHGRLVSRLVEQGAKVIVFDLFFKDLGSQKENALFAEAMHQAGNVILFEKLTTADSQANSIQASIRIPPTERIAEAAAGLASNPYPTGSLRVNQIWLFDPSNPHRATLPFLAFQLYTLPLFEDLRNLLQKIMPKEAATLPQHPTDIQIPKGIEQLVEALRGIFMRHPTLGETLLNQLDTKFPAQHKDKAQLLASLIKAYSGESTRFIDFYGPPRTISTIPYFCILLDCSSQRLGNNSTMDFTGKVVFVGLSELVQTEQQDRFPTVFRAEDGLDISGVEIAATAFANLLEDRRITPLPLFLHLLIVLLWGILIGSIFHGVSISRLQHRSGLLMATFAGLGLGIGLMYFSLILWAFSALALWLPLVVPLLIQLPVGLIAALFGTYQNVNHQRLITEKALANYVPDPVAKPLAQRIAEVSSQGQVVYGLCLYTDAEGYTKVSEALEENPDKLQALMNRYFEALCTPVRERDGIVSDITGDAVLAIWPARLLTPDLRKTVCLAALDLLAAVAQFNRSEPNYSLPTRVGLSGGPMFVGKVGIVDYVTYRPLGDIVNTASRIENLSKQMGTHLLASHLVVDDLSGILTRKIGRFQLIGKTKPVEIYELLCRESQADSITQETIQQFRIGLEQFHAQQWDLAEKSFQTCIQLRGDDGPSRFYLPLCHKHREHPPPADWQGTIVLSTK